MSRRTFTFGLFLFALWCVVLLGGNVSRGLVKKPQLDELQIHVFDIVTRGQKDPLAIPLWCVPLFYDRDELEEQLRNIDYPVKQFEFVWNSDDRDVGELLGRLGKIPFGVSIRHAPENL